MNAGTLKERISNRRYKYMAFDESELAELAAALDDRDHLEWLETHSTYEHCCDPETGEFLIHRVTGNINDREWNLVARGLTLRAAIANARGKS